MSHDSDENERILAEWLAGERSSDDPDVLALSGTSAEMAARMEELQATSRRLRGAREAERLEVEREVAGMGPPTSAELDSVRRSRPERACLVREEIAPRPRPAVRRWIAVAAAVVLAVVLLDRVSNGGDGDTYLGPGGVSDLQVAPGTGALRWTGTLPDGCVYRVVVFDTVDGPRVLVDESRDLTTPEWKPDTTPWPDAVTWEVRVVDPSGQVLSSSASAWRR